MMKRLLLMIAVFVLAAPQVQAQSDTIAVDLAVDHVDISTGFNGSYLSLFGVQNEEGDVAVTIKGPRRTMVVRRKENIFGIWMNRTGVRFENVPIYYDYALSKPEGEIAPREVLAEHMIGTDTLRFPPADKVKVDEVPLFQDALIRNKQEQALFPKEPQPLTYVDDGFFRTTFYLPSNVPTGMYTLETFLIKNGKVKSMRTTEVTVAQVGRSAAINSFAHSWSFTYGFLCVVFAMGIGWLSNVIRRRLR